MTRPLTSCVRTVSVLLLNLTLVSVVAVGAQTGSDPPNTPAENASNRQSLALLRGGRFVELDQKTNGLQRAYEAGTLSDESLLHEFRAFYDSDPSLEAQYDAWVKQFPRSYAAHLARGIYLRYRAKDARGSRYVSQTPKKQLDLMDQYTDQAMPDYTASLGLTSKPILTYHSIIGVAMLHGDDRTSRRMLEEAERIDPKNFIVRFKYFNALQTRWGGSLEQMLEFEQKMHAAGFSAGQLRSFANLIAVEREWLNDPEHCSCASPRN